MMTMKNVKLMVAMAALVCLNGSVFAAKPAEKPAAVAEAKKDEAPKADAAATADAATKKVDAKKDDCKPGVVSRAWCQVKTNAVEFKDYLKGQSKKDAAVRIAGVAAITYLVVKAANAAYNLVAEDDNA